MYCTAFIANMGSMKGISRQFRAPYHHLFSWGNCSLFFGIGTHDEQLRRNPATGEIESRRVQEFILTYDDRISEGIYGAKAIDLLTTYIENPGLLEEVPEIPPECLEELKMKHD